MSAAREVEKELKKLSDPKRALQTAKFFKTGKGYYAEQEVFLGLSMAQLCQVAKKFRQLPFSQLKILLNSEIHTCRMAALLILVDQFAEKPKAVFDFYISNIKRVNNWDLVDVSAPKIVGVFLLDKKRDILYRLAKSKNFWERRIAIVSTYAFIKQGDLKDTFEISKLLLNDKEDLIHKAVGWMLREAGKKDITALRKFLDSNIAALPRTTLRYAIEKFDKKERQVYLKKR